MKKINKKYNKLENELYPVEVQRLDALVADVDLFVSKTVPEAIELRSGEISRNIRREYETYDVEKAKERKRYRTT